MKKFVANYIALCMKTFFIELFCSGKPWKYKLIDKKKIWKNFSGTWYFFIRSWLFSPCKFCLATVIERLVQEYGDKWQNKFRLKTKKNLSKNKNKKFLSKNKKNHYFFEVCHLSKAKKTIQKNNQQQIVFPRKETNGLTKNGEVKYKYLNIRFSLGKINFLWIFSFLSSTVSRWVVLQLLSSRLKCLIGCATKHLQPAKSFEKTYNYFSATCRTTFCDKFFEIT